MKSYSDNDFLSYYTQQEKVNCPGPMTSLGVGSTNITVTPPSG